MHREELFQPVHAGGSGDAAVHVPVVGFDQESPCIASLQSPGSHHPLVTPLFPVVQTQYTSIRPAGSPVNLYLLTLYRDYMNLSCQNPAFVIVILWGIAIFTTTFLFMGSANLTSGIAIQGVCMIGSAAYLRKRGDTCRTRKQEI